MENQRTNFKYRKQLNENKSKSLCVSSIYASFFSFATHIHCFRVTRKQPHNWIVHLTSHLSLWRYKHFRYNFPRFAVHIFESPILSFIVMHFSVLCHIESNRFIQFLPKLTWYVTMLFSHIWIVSRASLSFLEQNNTLNCWLFFPLTIETNFPFRTIISYLIWRWISKRLTLIRASCQPNRDMWYRSKFLAVNSPLTNATL